MRTIFTMSMAALLLCATALATACDLSCALAVSHGNCQLRHPVAPDSTSTQMAMDGTMAGMDMSGMRDANSANPSLTSRASRGELCHARLADMGMCKRQSCEQLQALTVSESFSTAKQSTTTSAPNAHLGIESLRGSVQHPREGTARPRPEISGPLNANLRI